MEERRARVWTRLQVRLAEEETRNRLAEVENQMNQMAAMMAEMKALIITARGSYPTIPNIGAPNAGETSHEEQNRNKEPIQENPPKAKPEVVNLEEEDTSKKTSYKPKDEEGAKRLAKIEECLTSQGYELWRFDKFSPYAKVVVLENYKELEFVSKYGGSGCPKSHLKYYLRKMARYSDNTPLLITTFQDSLRGSALAWYTTLDIKDFTK
ncbi:uncharacterized protein LOC115677553 [Syzygium oleosum]|uniref:uncharacterized protein LOC115677553 n=1 Tax=Syzygium oleosum TaxID=219896 RepID=UPI0011D1E62B|nr:uncharacterized protein LOC115677553 [Syzygium oleosum]